MAHRYIFTDSVMPSSVSRVSGASTLFNYRGQAGIVLKRVNSLAEAAACGGVMMFFRPNVPEDQSVMRSDYLVEVGYCGAALNAYLDFDDPVIGWQVEASLRSITNDVRYIGDDAGLLCPDLEVAYTGVTPVRYRGSQLVNTAPDMTVLVFGWVTRAATGVLTNMPDVGGVGGDTAMRMFLKGRIGPAIVFPDQNYAGGLVCQAPVPIKWRALLTSARDDYLSAASGDALTYLRAAYDELLAAQPIDKTVLQPVVIHFRQDGSMMIGLTTPTEAYVIGQLGQSGFDPRTVSAIMGLISSAMYNTDSPAGGVSRIKVSDGYGHVLNGVPIPGFGFGYDVNVAPTMSSLPGQIDGVQAAALLSSAFPVNYDTKYGVDETANLNLNQILHPLPSNVIDPQASASTANGATIYRETPQSTTTVRMSWQDMGPGVFGVAMSFLNAVDQLAKKKAKG